MSVTFELPADFLLAQEVTMTVEDLRYGCARSFLKPTDVIALAAHEMAHGAGAGHPADFPAGQAKGPGKVGGR